MLTSTRSSLTHIEYARRVVIDETRRSHSQYYPVIVTNKFTGIIPRVDATLHHCGPSQKNGAEIHTFFY